MTAYGYVCDRCGLSDVGYDRFIKLGFPPRPCDQCREHFRQRDEEAEW